MLVGGRDDRRGDSRRLEAQTGGAAPLPVKQEMRRNLIRKLEAGETLFPGVLGYDDIGRAPGRERDPLAPQHDPARPARAGQEPAPAQPDHAARSRSRPWSPAARSTTTRCGRSAAAAATSIAGAGRRDARSRCLTPDDRYVEKLATPDVTIADIIGDVDPIRAARGGHDLASELTMHYGLLPRAHRGIFALNELPDLAGRIQVGLFNILQEGDVQIKGYPIRLPLDVCMVFTANPEDYTARGKIITPAQGPHRQRDPHPLPGHHRAGRGHHAAGGLDGPRPRAARAPLHPRGGGGRRLRRPPRQEDRQAQRGQPAPAHQRARERDLQRGAARRPAQGGRWSSRACPTSTPPCPRSPASSSWSTRAS